MSTGKCNSVESIRVTVDVTSVVALHSSKFISDAN